jgi:hypothetical protein
VSIVEWNDGRLNDLQAEVRKLGTSLERVHEALGNVGILAEQMRGLRSQLNDVNKDLEDIGGNPLQERRERRKLIIVGIISGVTTGGVGAVVGVIAGVHP